MADTGYNWGAFVATQKGAGDWSADALADNATETSDVIDATGKAAIVIGIGAVEDNTGAIDGVVTVFILADVDGTNFEETTIGNPFSFQFTPVQNDTVYIPISLSMANYDRFKIAIFNEGGQELAITVKHKFATIPVAS